MTATRTFRIGCWQWSSSNPYQQLFYQALAPWGVQLRTDVQINDAWLRYHSTSLDALHFHWPEDIWRTRGNSWVGRLHGVVGFTRFLKLARSLGIKLIWTVHNLECHEGADWIDRRGYRALARCCDLIICHSQLAADRMKHRDRPAGQIVVMPHGNYEAVYPNPRHRDVVRREWELSGNIPLVCCLGHLRKYKGLQTAIDAAGRVGERIQLLVAGAPHPQYDMAPLRTQAAGLRNVRIVERTLTDSEFADIIAASDAVLLPYLSITGSGALLAAWTLGRGVVASDLPYFREVAEHESDAAMLFPPGNAALLAEAMSAYLAIPHERRSTAARRLAQRYSWDRCITPVANVIHQWTSNGVEPPVAPPSGYSETCVMAADTKTTPDPYALTARQRQ